MPKISILHFSDIHWHDGNKESVRIVRDAMVKDLQDLQKDGLIKFDMALFTGDLVLAGENGNDFDTAHKEVLRPILEAAQLSESDLFICPGNHDASRKLVRDSDFIEEGLKQKLISVDAVNQLMIRYDRGDPNAELAMQRMSNYESYLNSHFNKPDAQSGMVRVYDRTIHSKKVVVACFDNSWRSTGEAGGVDRNNLLLGERNVDFSTQYIKDADLAIAIFHHPLSWLAEFDASSISPRLNNAFDIMAYGHVHSTEPEIKTTVNGSALISQSGSMYAGRSYYNGYQVIQIDPAICQAEVILRTYFDSPGRRFGPAENIVAGGKAIFRYFPTRGQSDPNIELLLREARPEIRRLALEQFNISDIGAEICSDPHTAFVCPPIFVSHSRIDGDRSVKEEDNDDDEIPNYSEELIQKEISITEVLRNNSNYLMVGDRETGKTSLAHFISVMVSEGECDQARVPVLLDYKSFKGNLYSLKRAAASYLGMSTSGFDIEASLEKGSVLVIIDNYSGHNRKNKKGLENLIEKYPQTRWILLADNRFGSLNKSTEDNDLIEGFVTAKLDKLPRRLIREMTKRWCEKTGTNDEETFGTIMTQIRSNDLPRTGYIVTLLLWALHQDRQLERINESFLIMNMVDYLLGKADFRTAREGEFDATSKEITLQSLAVFLREHSGIASPNDTIQFLIEFFRTKGLNYDARDILNTLSNCGVLIETTETVRFKYRCFQEYFLAKHMISSNTRLKEAYLNRAYLENTRELEILSGLTRENDELIDELILQLENYSPDPIKNISLDRFEGVIQEESSVGISRRRLQKIREKKLTPTQIDDLMDAAEAQLAEVKKPPKPKIENSQSPSPDVSEDTFETKSSNGDEVFSQPPLKILSFIETKALLGKILRNSEFTSKERKLRGLRLYAQSSAKFFLQMYEIVSNVFDKMVEDVNEDGSVFDEESIRGLHYYLTKRMMLSVEGTMAEDIASKKLVPVIEEVLSSGDISVPEKTFLVSLQLDCPNENWDNHWKKHTREFKKYRIVTEFLAEKLWQHIHRKALSAKEFSKVETTALELELALGRPRSSKGHILQGIRTQAKANAPKDGT